MPRKTFVILKRALAPVFALAVALGLAGSAWAATDGSLNYSLTANTASSGNTVTVDDITYGNFAGQVLNTDNAKLLIPASDSLPAGTVISVSKIELTENSTGDTSSQPTSITINSVTSATRSGDDGAN